MPQHRHHGPHRRGQDDDHRAHPVLHRRQPPYRRSARRHRDHGLDGAGAGARHHDHLRRDDLHLEQLPHQHHRHARPRGLHGRGGAFAARARRCRGLFRRGGRCAAPVRDGVAPGDQVQGPAYLLHQQDGQDWRRRRVRHQDHPGSPRCEGRSDPACHRR